MDSLGSFGITVTVTIIVLQSYLSTLRFIASQIHLELGYLYLYYYETIKARVSKINLVEWVFVILILLQTSAYNAFSLA